MIADAWPKTTTLVEPGHPSSIWQAVQIGLSLLNLPETMQLKIDDGSRTLEPGLHEAGARFRTRSGEVRAQTARRGTPS